jgi:hypothetical protein
VDKELNTYIRCKRLLASKISYITHTQIQWQDNCTEPLEHLLLEVGISTNLTLVNYDKYQTFATNCLVKSTWEFLYKHNMSLEHNITIPKNTVHDQPLMLEICKHNLSVQELEAINQCRLYLQAYYISDIATTSSHKLSYHAWEGVNWSEGCTSRCIWLKQGMPSKASWITWRQILKTTILTRGM